MVVSGGGVSPIECTAMLAAKLTRPVVMGGGGGGRIGGDGW